jgi:hypothetical protein
MLRRLVRRATSKSRAGPGSDASEMTMSKADEYEAHAQLAEAEAGQPLMGEHRKQLLLIASQWWELARQLREEAASGSWSGRRRNH